MFPIIQSNWETLQTQEQQIPKESHGLGMEQLTRYLSAVDYSKSKNKSFTKRFGAESV